MKTMVLTAGCTLVLSACATTATQTAWGKPGISRVEYGTDVGMCTGLSVAQNVGNAANTAGGINGANNTPATNSPGVSGAAAARGAASAANGGPAPAPQSTIPASGAYSGMASSDFAQRAATQQRTREMAEQRARATALKGCLVERGYQEYALTGEQRAHLATLKKGSNAYHEYLYTLGSDADVVVKQKLAPAR